LWRFPRKLSIKKIQSIFVIEFIIERISDIFRTSVYTRFELIGYLVELCFINRDFVLIELNSPLFLSLYSLFLFLFFSLSFFVILSQSTYIYIHIYMDKEVHCTFRCVVVFSGWTCLVANSVKRWKAALTWSVIGKTLTRYSGLLWRCFRYLPKKKKKEKGYFFTYLHEGIFDFFI